MTKPHDDEDLEHDLEKKNAHDHAGTEAAAVVSGAAIGALTGAIAGPIGAVAGAVIGGAAGAVAGIVLDRTEGQAEAERRKIESMEAEADEALSQRPPRGERPEPPKEKTWEDEVEESLRDPKP